ncbi:bifunctional protein TilS/HprT [Myxococcaceae bacterium]|nr:bifunctional protein TilS/HprT [Myxococcaceae bacterium]
MTSRVVALPSAGADLRAPDFGYAGPVLRVLETSVRRLGLSGRAVLVAVSGGVDSTALLYGLASLERRLGLRLAVGHVNHGLRGADADADEALVRAHAAALGLAMEATAVRPATLREGGSSRSRPTLQEACRRLRYDALEAQACKLGCAAIATAHTADDQAETVLLRVLRGAGGDGLTGIAEQTPDGRVVRPLLDVSRAEILDFAGRRGLRWREDASNDSDEYARNRLRRRWLPGLAREFNPALLRTIARLAEAQRKDSEWMESLVDEAVKQRFEVAEDGLRIDATGFEHLPDALATRLARRALRLSGGARDVSKIHLVRVVRFLREAAPGRALELPGRLMLRRDARGFRLAMHESSRCRAPSGARASFEGNAKSGIPGAGLRRGRA